MNGAKTFGGFVLGLLVAGGATFAFAQIKSEPSSLVQGGLDRGRVPTTGERNPPTYAMAEVDEGAYRMRTSIEVNGQTYRWTQETKADPELNKQLSEATNDSVRKAKLELLNRGFEPYAASVYNGSMYNNEYCWFFRKRIEE